MTAAHAPPRFDLLDRMRQLIELSPLEERHYEKLAATRPGMLAAEVACLELGVRHARCNAAASDARDELDRRVVAGQDVRAVMGWFGGRMREIYAPGAALRLAAE